MLRAASASGISSGLAQPWAFLRLVVDAMDRLWLKSCPSIRCLRPQGSQEQQSTAGSCRAFTIEMLQTKDLITTQTKQ